jgi:FMN phosphatase YigB (HAD superfamily)
METTEQGIIFIDWDGTLSRGRFWADVQRTEPATYELIQQTLFQTNHELVIDWMLGRVGSEHICSHLAEKIGVKYEKLWRSLIASCEQLPLSDGLKELLMRRSRDNRLVLVTDNMDCFSRFTAPALHLDKYFDSIINSSDVGRMKNDAGGQTFVELAKKAGVALGSCQVIDDSAKTCATVSGLGGCAHCTNGPEHTEQILRALLG